MEKIKNDLLMTFISFIFLIALICSFFIYFKMITISQLKLLPLIIVITILIAYLTQRFTSSGYYVSANGILINKKLIIPWEDITLKKGLIGWRICLGKNRSIPFDSFNQNPVIKLFKKYCPTDKEIFYNLEKVAKIKNYKF